MQKERRRLQSICVVSAKIRPSLRANKAKSYRNPLHDWSSLVYNLHIVNLFTPQLRDRFNAL